MVRPTEHPPSSPFADAPASALQGRIEHVFGSTQFFRLWIAQVASSTGDWLWFLAIAVTAERITDGVAQSAAVSTALLPRIGLALFLAPAVGALVDRWDRKRLLVVCDIGRALSVALIPLVQEIWQLVLLSLVLELLTLFWTPAKEAIVPHLVPEDRLTQANSLNTFAAYGTIPIAFAIWWLLDRGLEYTGETSIFGLFHLDIEAAAYLIDAGTYLLTAAVIGSLVFPRSARRAARVDPDAHVDFGSVWQDIRDGWQFTFSHPTVRAVNVGLSSALIGGAMLIPLGFEFANEVLGSASDYNTLVLLFGLGAALGVGLLALTQAQVEKPRAFVIALLIGGFLLILAASGSRLLVSGIAVAGLGICAGGIWVLGLTILHEEVDDDLRGRAFGSLYTLVRLGVMLALVLAPWLTEAINGVTQQFDEQKVSPFGFDIFVPGVRVVLWIGGIMIMLAAGMAATSLRVGRDQHTDRDE